MAGGSHKSLALLLVAGSLLASFAQPVWAVTLQSSSLHPLAARFLAKTPMNSPARLHQPVAPVMAWAEFSRVDHDGGAPCFPNVAWLSRPSNSAAPHVDPVDHRGSSLVGQHVQLQI